MVKVRNSQAFNSSNATQLRPAAPVTECRPSDRSVTPSNTANLHIPKAEQKDTRNIFLNYVLPSKTYL